MNKTAINQIALNLGINLRGGLKPGERVYDEDFQARLGTIRSAIHAALTHLGPGLETRS